MKQSASKPVLMLNVTSYNVDESGVGANKHWVTVVDMAMGSARLRLTERLLAGCLLKLFFNITS